MFRVRRNFRRMGRRREFQPAQSNEESSRRLRRRGRGARLAALAVWLLLAAPSSAVTIHIDFDDHGENPSYDPNGTALLAIANAAAQIWEGYLPEPGSYSLDVWWANDLDSDTLGRWSVEAVGDNNIRINNNPLAASAIDWYLDSTPLIHDEFAMQQILFRDLDASDQSGLFDGGPPGVMEVGYWGKTDDPTIEDQYDLLSVLLHEIGHDLGVNDAGFGGPWEADPSWLPGYSAEFLTPDETDPDDGDDGHLSLGAALMSPSTGLGARTLPSSIDIMAVGDDEGMKVLDFPRQDFLGSGPWHSSSRWTEGHWPDSNDDAGIRDGNTALLTANAHVENLEIAFGSSLTMQSGTQLRVDAETLVSNESSGSDLWVGNGALAQLKNLTLAGGDLHLLDGTVEVNGQLIMTNDGVGGGRISTHGGQIGVRELLRNDGEIAAFGGVTEFHYLGFAPNVLDLDGQTEQGEVKALLGDLVFHCGLTDDFNSQMTINEDASITVNSSWTFGPGSHVRLMGGNDGAATLAGNGTLAFAGELLSAGLGAADGILAAAQSRFELSADVSVGDDDRLVLETHATFSGASFGGDGTLEQQGDIVVDRTTTIATQTYDWGNSGSQGVRQTTVNRGVAFRVNSETTGGPNNEYRGVMLLAGGDLAVNLDEGWLLPRRGSDLPGGVLPPGTLILQPGRDVEPVRVTGVPLTVEGFVRAHGGLSRIESKLVSTPYAEVRALAGAELRLEGDVVYGGGQFVDDGQLAQWGDALVTSDTTIATQYFDFDGNEAAPSTTVVEPQVTFAIDSQRLDQPGEAYDGTVQIHGGNLQVNVPGGWTLGPGGVLSLTNVDGPGWVLGTPLNVAGTIQTTGGNEIFAPVTLGASAVVSAMQPDDVLRFRNHTNYEGGVYAGSGGIIQEGDAYVNAPTGVDLGFFDLDGVNETTFIELHDDFYLNVQRIDASDNRFDGVLEATDDAVLSVNTPERWEMAGTLNVAGPPGNTLTIAGAPLHLTADVVIQPDNRLEVAANLSGPGGFNGGGEVVLLGDYSPGASPAVVTVDADLRLTPTSTLAIELGGTAPGLQYDQLQISGSARLDGMLSVSLLTDADGAPFLPEPGDAFEILSALGGLQGAFGSLELPSFVANLGLTWELQQDPQALTLRVLDVFESLPGDFNQNGLVDDGDLAVWAGEWGQAGPALASDANGNGGSDGADFLAWQRQFGKAISTTASLQIAVPEPATTALMLAGLLAGGCRRRR